MPVLKQSLLFKDHQATTAIFVIAENLSLYLSDVIDCIEDLDLVIQELPAQQYGRLINKLERNLQTQNVREAVMAKRGEKSKMATFIQESAQIWDQTPELGLHRELIGDELKHAVSLRVLPLAAIQSHDSQLNLFHFIRENLTCLQGSLLLNAIF